MENLTPMQKQYTELKEKHSDAILLFRLGDFYEAFNKDAQIISEVLGITLTGRGKDENRIPMAGIPYHAIDNYLYKLVEAGYKIAIAEQLSEPETGKLVERSITKIVTAGTFTDSKSLKAEQNNFIACFYFPPKQKNYTYIAYLDLTTGEFYVQQIIATNLKNTLNRISPSEVIISDELKNLDLPLKNTRKEFVYASDFDLKRSYEVLIRHFKITSLKGFGIESDNDIIIPAGVLLEYAKENQKTDLHHIRSVKVVKSEKYMQLDAATITNLELVRSIRQDGEENTLFSTLNNCSTALGMRLLRKWLLLPLIDMQEINNRLDAVKFFVNQTNLTSHLRNSLSSIMDIERIISRIGTGNINGRDLIGLKNSLKAVCEVNTLFQALQLPLLLKKTATILHSDNYTNCIELIEKAINEDCPVFFDKGGIIKEGFDAEIDELRILRAQGSGYLNQLQEREKKRTGITTLKIRYNKVFGYYIEVSKSQSINVPSDYIRKQTLVNAERFITPELKTYEEKILTAEERLIKREQELFNELINELRKYIEIIQAIANSIAVLDITANFAHLAVLRKYIKPTLTNENKIEIESGRHPVVELIRKENFIPNDLILGVTENKGSIMILTGPNMSGKSTYIRQCALICLMAQIGCFVPAQKATLKILDRVFTRVGASDNLSAGESTFMVEMNETANILNNATLNSLIILDEVGRGTSTYDGVAIAWSIVEYIQNHIKAMTLFATHYHELIKLDLTHKEIINYHVDVLEKGNDVVFTHKILPGGMNKSYGVHVAKLAGIPAKVISRAYNILNQLENTQKSKQIKDKLDSINSQNPQFPLFQ